ncbi:helix-turn-helix domain-containing protein [Mesonia aquimarina]|uniref:helix-turn-helix domain-containing protein n=1 Tax=Mesonia aquimarina TaxID=1504967 RepID=UPI000EF59136|nr:AraC family transcriptional regulator [Mesonia aquimarina]
MSNFGIKPLLKRITITSNNQEDVIKEIAHSLSTTYAQNCSECLVEIPSHTGKGFIKSINFEGGLTMMDYQCIFFEDTQFIFKGSKNAPLKFLFNLKSNLLHFLEGKPNPQSLEGYQRAIITSDVNHSHAFYFPKKDYINFNSLEIERYLFKNKMSTELQNLSPELNKIFGDISTEKFFYHKGYYNLKIADLLHEIRKFEEEDFLKKIFLEGKAYQILGHHLRLFQQDLRKNSISTLRSSEVENIKRIAQLIKSDLTNIKTVNRYAQDAGLNVNKLQLGFQELYELTVNRYIQKVRLEKAQELLATTDCNISEIVDKIGLSSKSYFSKLFRENYQMSPSEFRKKNQNFYGK